jgi:hypothetical protein
VRENTQAPKEDFKDVVTRMKTVERTPVASTLRFKEKSAVEAPSWTHVTEERGSLEKSEPLVEEAAEIKKEEPAPEALPVIEEPASAAPIAVETTAGYEAPEEQASLVQEEPERVRQGIAEPVHVELAHVQQTPSTTQAYAETPYQGEQKLPIIYFVAVILAASLLGIGISYYFFVVRNAPVQQIVVEYKVPQLLFTSDQVPFRFGEDRRQSLQVIKDFVDRSQTVSQLYPTVIEEGIEKPAPTQTIISELQFQAPGSFTRTISEITFGGTPQRQPFIILKVTSFDTAFAGILEWEKTMSADLTPLFGEVVINSFDPSARTDTQVREAFFKDVIASNKNARLLLDEEGEDRIVYTFTNQNTILITTNREALDELLPLIR